MAPKRRAARSARRRIMQDPGASSGDSDADFVDLSSGLSSAAADMPQPEAVDLDVVDLMDDDDDDDESGGGGGDDGGGGGGGGGPSGGSARKRKGADDDVAANGDDAVMADAAPEDAPQEDAPQEPKPKKRKRAPKKPKEPCMVSEAMLLEQGPQDLDEYVWEPEKAAQPPGMTTQLLGFQRESLFWMTRQENATKWWGGMLADEMGMGKTVQAIALVCNNRPEAGGPGLAREVPSTMYQSANEPGKPFCKATLVVCPVIALYQWRKEILRHTREGELSVMVYHGKERTADASEFHQHDVVLTTYSIVEAAFRYERSGCTRKGEKVLIPSLIHSLMFYRIILDEAHSIKDRSCSTARSCFALSARFRWALTGTPLQNRVGELYSIVRFMRVVPFSFYFCKKCDCRSLTWNFSTEASCCAHRNYAHFSWWNRHIANPIIKYGSVGAGEDAMLRIRHILQRCMIRRTKAQCADQLRLPPRNIIIRKDRLDPEENDFYESLYQQSRTTFEAFVDEGSILNNYAHVFDLLLRLRQAVDHPYLVLHSKPADVTVGKDVCGLCFDPCEDVVTTKCKHSFCRQCITDYLNNGAAATAPPCPVCRTANLVVDLRPEAAKADAAAEAAASAAQVKAAAVRASKTTILNRIDLGNWRSSTKIEALLEEIDGVRRRDPTAKCLVFSQFVNLLDLVHWRLRIGGFGAVKLDGRMNAVQRSYVIDQFNTDPGTTVLLISLKAGGVALNLTAASYCFLMDPWWNPAVEQQAFDRCHRLGQHKPNTVVRFIIADTIEERVLQLQQKKLLLFQSTVGMDKSALTRLSVEDLQFLFSR